MKINNGYIIHWKNINNFGIIINLSREKNMMKVNPKSQKFIINV